MVTDRPEGENRVVPEDRGLLMQVLESTNDCLWMFSADWEELLFVNSSYEDIFGRPVSALEADPPSFVNGIHPDDRERVTTKMELLSTGEHAEAEYRVDPDEGYETWVWTQAQPVFEGGEQTGVVGYTRDITERKRYQQELQEHKEDLEQSNESLRQFAYIASHDLQEPLRMVSSYVDLLEQEYGDQLDEEAAEYMAFAVDGAHRMKRMINSLLQYSRVLTEAEAFQETDANAVVEASRKDLELLIDETDAEVTVEELPTVQADRDQLGQLFQNLLKNGIEHASADGPPRVAVRASERVDAHEFSVVDDGPGVPVGEQDDVFEIFKQGGSSSAEGNTGIGLAVARRIVQRHGGSIWVDPETDDGEGATFRFTIPKAPRSLDPEASDS